MSIKKEIDRAVKLTAALNGNTTPKTPAEQDQLKLTKGTTPCLPKEWLEKTRQLSDIIGDFFYQGKKSDYENLPEEDRYIVKMILYL